MNKNQKNIIKIIKIEPKNREEKTKQIFGIRQTVCGIADFARHCNSQKHIQALNANATTESET